MARFASQFNICTFEALSARVVAPRHLISKITVRHVSWGFIGLGRMGYPIARNLRKQLPNSDALSVYDVNPQTTQKFANETHESVQILKSPRDITAASEVIFTALPESSHVKSVFQDILASSNSPSAPKERLFIDFSTIDLSTSREIAKSVHDTHNGCFVDAPMSGGVVGAEAGTLTFMLGAPASLVKRITKILSMLGKRVIHCGDQGSGLSAKLANNYLLAISNIATAEAMNLGIKWGLDPKVLSNLINASSGRCWSSEINNPVPGVLENAPASKYYEGGFSVALMKKDLNLAISAAEEVGAALKLHEKAREVYEELSRDTAYKGKDFSVVYKHLADNQS